MTSKELRQGNRIGLLECTVTHDGNVTHLSEPNILVDYEIDNIFNAPDPDITTSFGRLEKPDCYVFIKTSSGGRPCTEKVLLSQCLPIPLTEDWLLKFGFEKVKDIDAFVIWSFPDINFTFETDRNFVMLDSHIIANTKYVHQMQNLFLVLTQSELEIK